MTLYQNLRVITTIGRYIYFPVSSRLAESSGIHAALWVFLRGVDLQRTGCGRVAVTIPFLMEHLQKSKPTIRRWIARCKRDGLLRVQRVGEVYVFYYTALIKAALRKDLEELGALANLSLEELRRLRFSTTEAEMMHGQRQSDYAKKMELRSQRKRERLHSLDKIFSSSLSCQTENSRGEGRRLIKRRDRKRKRTRAIIAVGKRYAFVASFFTVRGISQQTAAHRLGRSVSTIQRRLDDSYRAKRGIPPVAKKQLAVNVPDLRPFHGLDWQEQAHAIALLSSHSDAKQFAQLFNCMGMVWRAACNWYASAVEIVGRPFLRRTYRTVRLGNPTTVNIDH